MKPITFMTRSSGMGFDEGLQTAGLRGSTVKRCGSDSRSA